MRSDAAALPVAIVGGGFSGLMAAAQLARRGVPSMLIEGGGKLGRGLAYSTTEPSHILNVVSARMSAWPDEPDHFQRWLGDDGTSFAERRVYGRYLQELLDGVDGVTALNAEAVAAERVPEGWSLQLADGRQVTAAALVLAQGNQPPGSPEPCGDLPADIFVNDPWSAHAAAQIARVAADGGDVLLLGTGLTMVDTLLSLNDAGHRGQVVALSRRGLLPRSHAPHDTVPVSLEELPRATVAAMTRWLRRRSEQVGFRAAVDSLRPHTRAIWQGWGVAEQRRFLRHARPWWDVHRHRIAPEVAERVAGSIAEGRLEVVAGRLRSLAPSGYGRIALRRGNVMDRRFGLVVNCTGPLGDLRRTADPLLRHLLDEGPVRLDPHGLGVHVDDRSCAGERLWALGPLTKGMYWEIVAVPDIRGQVAKAAEDIARELGAG